MKLALLLLLATGAVVSAQSLTVQTRTTTAPEMGTIRYLQLHCDGQTYTMSPPSADWRSKLDGAKARLQFFAPLGTAVATLRFTTGAARDRKSVV